jgi:Zn-finger protein
MDDESLRAVTPDHKNMPKKEKEIEPFVEVILDIEPFCSYYIPLDKRDMWKGLMDVWKCNKIYLRRDRDTVRTLKILLSACFTVDIAIENIHLRILKETIAGSNNYFPCTLEDDNTVLGLHHAVKDNRVWIWYSKKRDMQMWSVLDHKIAYSKSKEETLFNENIMEDTMKVVEDKWLIFVSQNLEIIYEVLDYTLLVWFEGGEKEKLLMRGDSTTNINTIEQLEERRTRFDRLQMAIMKRRVLDETPMMRYEREDRLHELYYNGNDPRSV